MKEDNKNFELLLKNALEEYLMEDVGKQLEGFEDLEDPEYSEEYKQFIEGFFEREKNRKKNNWKKWGSVAAVFLCCCIFFNQSITASIKKVFNNVSTKQTEISFDVKKKAMYVEYDLNAFPDGWDVLFLPNDMINGYVVKKIEGDGLKIQIKFANSKGEELLYTLYKEELRLPGDFYEFIEIKNVKGYYFEKLNQLILECEREGLSYVQIETDDLEKNDIIWIAKNIVYVYR